MGHLFRAQGSLLVRPEQLTGLDKYGMRREAWQIQKARGRAIMGSQEGLWPSDPRRHAGNRKKIRVSGTDLNRVSQLTQVVQACFSSYRDVL